MVFMGELNVSVNGEIWNSSIGASPKKRGVIVFGRKPTHHHASDYPSDYPENARIFPVTSTMTGNPS